MSRKTKTKNVSWHNISIPDKETEKLPSTPHPKTKKIKPAAISTPISLYDSDEDTKKRKRSKTSNWVVTYCPDAKPDKTNRPLKKEEKEENPRKRRRVVNTRNGSYVFDEDTFTSKQIQEQIFKTMFQDEVDELLNSDSESPDELVPIESESSSDESDLNLDVLFNPPEIKLDTKKCQIIEPKIKTLKQRPIKTNSNNTPIINSINILEKVEYFISDIYCILILKHPFKLYFNGKLSIKILSGKLEILGHTLDATKPEFEIYNPRGQSFLCLETLASKRNPHVVNELKKYFDEDLSKLKVNDNDCVIAVRNLKNNMTDYLQKHIAQHLYPNTMQLNKRPLLKLENKLSCLFEAQTASLKLYKKHKDWMNLVNKSLIKVRANHSRTILCGGKSVGKSTLLRYMINSLLNRVDEVVCIDLDPGQSEFTISGCVSVTVVGSPIFGPNYTHLKQPKKSFFIGDVNVTGVLDRYISCVKELLAYCEQNISKNLPWIINCMGFTKSIGADIIVLIIKLLQPSIVVQMESAKKSNNYTSLLTREFVDSFVPSFPLEMPNNPLTYSLEIINSVAEDTVSGEWISEPRFLREMCILSYFSQMLDDKKEITAVTPYGVKLSSIKLHNVNYSKEHILATMNGNLVALCESNESAIETSTPLTCYGFGIVRGIDKQSGELYLLTPVQENVLDSVNTLIRGNIALPPSIYMSTGHQGLVPYIQLGTLQGTSAIPKRSFISWKVLNKK